jgi:Sensors of blue-light using FAD
MLVRLLYASRATDQIDQQSLSAILAKSRANNPGVGVTGVLCFSGGTFMQVLEGGRLQVSELYNHIARDNRHRDVVLLSYEEIQERRFAHWSMGQVNLARINPALLIKYSETASLDPYAVSGAASMSMFEEMIATANIVGQG